MTTYSENKKRIQQLAASKITQQKGSEDYKEDSTYDCINHCRVAVVKSLPVQRLLIRGH